MCHGHARRAISPTSVLVAWRQLASRVRQQAVRAMPFMIMRFWYKEDQTCMIIHATELSAGRAAVVLWTILWILWGDRGVSLWISPGYRLVSGDGTGIVRTGG